MGEALMGAGWREGEHRISDLESNLVRTAPGECVIARRQLRAGGKAREQRGERWERRWRKCGEERKKRSAREWDAF